MPLARPFLRFLPAGAVRALAAAVVLGAVPGLARAQSADSALTGTWRLHTSLQRTTAVAVAGDSVVWAASTGGVYRVGTEAGSAVRAYTTVDGLASLDARAIAVDTRRRAVWIGYTDGVVDRLDVATGTVRTLRDIARADRFAQRAVTRLVAAGDTVYAATRFGVVAFDAARLVVRETYSRVGTLAAASPVYDVARVTLPDAGAALALALDGGVAFGALDGRNLQDPSNWSVEAVGAPVRSVAMLAGRIHAGTTAGVFVRSGAGTWTRVDGVPGPVRRLAPSGAGLVAAVAENGAATIPSTGPAVRTPGLPAQDVAAAGALVALADSTRGLVLARPLADGTLAVERRIEPPGPSDDVFSSLSAGVDGTLWATGTGTGAFRLDPDGTAWTSFTPALVAAFPREARVVDATPDGGAWVGTYGDGAVRIAPDGTFVQYTRANSTLRTSDVNDPNYEVVNGVSVSRDGRTVWASNQGGTPPLHVFADGAWTALPIPATSGYSATYTAFGRTYLDAYGNVWSVVLNEGDLKVTRGLLVVDPGSRVADASDDRARFFGTTATSGRGLPSSASGPSNAIAAIVEDRRARLWVGTDKGLAYLPNSSVIAEDPVTGFVWPTTRPAADGTRGFVLLGLRVRALAVDASDALWVGSDEGLLRVEDRGDGFDVTARLTPANSPLPSERITALAVSPRTGHLYVGTEAGLAVYEGAPVPTAAAPEPLVVYPNPLRLAEGMAERVTLRTLVADTDVRILAPDGRVVRRLSGRGGSLDWDARDDRGDLVPSGVYLVVAVGGGGTATGRIAVIR